MKTIYKISLMLIVIVGLAACKDDIPYVEPTLDVTYANVEGVWKLVEWNAEELSEDAYLYIDFNRRERTYEMYQKFDSMYARYITGSYSINDEEDLGSIITGKYDYGMGKWNNDYIVTNLLESGSMIWTAKADDTDISKYIRVDEVPAEVIAEAKR